jgi:hypothetical protein
MPPVKQNPPTDVPILTCPFTGKDLVIEKMPIGTMEKDMWHARGPFWTSFWYDSKQALLHDISTRGGISPAFPRSRPPIEVRLIEAPPSNPAAGRGGKLDDQTQAVVNAVAEQAAKHAKRSGV